MADVRPLGGEKQVFGTRAHDEVDGEGPVKIGHKAVDHGASPTAVAAGDRTDSYANRDGIPFVMGGHMNTVTRRDNFTAAETDTALVTVSGGTKIVVTHQMITAHNSNSVDVQARTGFGATTTPTAVGVVGSHPGMPPGGGFTVGNGGGILGIGADGEDLRITSGVPTGGSIDVVTTYFLIES